MSRFYVSIKHQPLIAIQFTEDLADKLKPVFINLFGMKFLESEHKDGDLLYYDFEGDENEFERLSEAILSVYNSHKVKDININISMN